MRLPWIEMCAILTTTALRVHALCLRPLATFCELKIITARLSSALDSLDETTKSAETRLLALEKLVDHATCCVNQLLADMCVNRRQANKIERWTIVGFVTRYLSDLSLPSKKKSFRAMRQRR